MWKSEEKSNKVLLDQAASGGSMVLLALALAAGVMYVVSKTGLIDLMGFESIGALMWVFILLLGSVFAYHFALLVTAEVKRQQS
jgi:hypothetical protein